MGYIESFLQNGSENAITANELRTLTGLSSTRMVSRHIEAERRSGTLILSNGLGYFLPSEDPATAEAEIRSFYSNMIARAASIFSVIKEMKDFAVDENQITIPGYMEDLSE